MQLNENEIEKMILDNKKLIFFVVNKEFPWLLGDDDIEQCGMIGLWKACKMYDPSKSRFATFATTCIRNEILMEMRKRKSLQRIEIVSIDTSVYNEDNDENGCFLNDVFGDFNNLYTIVECDLSFLDAELCDRDKKIFRLSMEGYTNGEIGKIIGISRSYVSRIVTRIRKKIEAAWS